MKKKKQWTSGIYPTQTKIVLNCEDKDKDFCLTSLFEFNNLVDIVLRIPFGRITKKFSIAWIILYIKQIKLTNSLLVAKNITIFSKNATSDKIQGSCDNTTTNAQILGNSIKLFRNDSHNKSDRILSIWFAGAVLRILKQSQNLNLKANVLFYRIN